jgi:hypothetical protein
MTSKLAFATAIGLLVLAGSASAQSPQMTQTVSKPLSCGDFQRNLDGSWSPLIPMTLNGISFVPGVAFAQAPCSAT